MTTGLRAWSLQAPSLLATLLDGLIWRSKNVKEGQLGKRFHFPLEAEARASTAPLSLGFFGRVKESLGKLPKRFRSEKV